MKKRIVKLIFFLTIFFFIITTISSETTPIQGLTRYVLENGMEVFIFETHVVPLVKVEITFRCGAISQRPETVGLFHLYEHMLFKGNKLYKSDSDFQSAMKELGVTSWNGGTSSEYVNYYFTIPSDKIEKGIAFWANAVRYPLFLDQELENEKLVVINEIRGSNNNPTRIYNAALKKKLFYKYPWRKDTGGSEEVIQSATREIMLEIQNTYYIPNNTDLFIGGDVNPDQVLEIVNKYFASWQMGPDPQQNRAEPHPHLEKDSYQVFADESMYKDVITVDIHFRGPDVLDNPKATYAADVWLMLLEDPNGKFKNSIYNKVPGIYRKELISASYFTQRDGAFIYFQTVMLVIPGQDTFKRVTQFKMAIIEEMTEIVNNPNYFADRDFQVVKTRIEDYQLINMETAESFIDNLSFWWSSATTEYYFNYIDNMYKTSYQDIKGFIEEYILSRKSITSIIMNPENFSNEKECFSNSEFEEITKDNAFWWSGK